MLSKEESVNVVVLVVLPMKEGSLVVIEVEEVEEVEEEVVVFAIPSKGGHVIEEILAVSHM